MGCVSRPCPSPPLTPPPRRLPPNYPHECNPPNHPHLYRTHTEATGLGGYIGYFGPFKLGRSDALGLQAIPTPSDAASKHAVTASKQAVQGTWVVSRGLGGGWEGLGGVRME